MNTMNIDTVRHIAKLCRLYITDQEATQYSIDLPKILHHIDVMNEVDTSKTAMTTQTSGKINSFREDIIKPFNDIDGLLKHTKMPIKEHMIAIPKVVDKE